LKKNEAGKVIKHKVQLVARGFVHQAGIDFDEVFAPVAAWNQSGCCLLWLPMKGGPSTTWTSNEPFSTEN
jgi:hypothetical protein